MWEEETFKLIEKALSNVVASDEALPQLAATEEPQLPAQRQSLAQREQLAQRITLLSRVLADQLWDCGYELVPRQHEDTYAPGVTPVD